MMPQAKWPEPLPAMFTGVAGDIVRTIEPHSEADRVALLLQTLVAFGSVVGSSPHFIAESDQHGITLFAVLVGMTAKGRKGSSWGHVRRLFAAVDPDWARDRVQSGLSSGEGLTWAVRDPIRKCVEMKGGKGEPPRFEDVEVDPGVHDKRLLVFESEFASTLRVAARDGSTLSTTVRQAWDSGNLQTLTKNSPARATGAHVSIIAHVTRDEVRRYLDRTEAANGFANRYLWACVRRSQELPEGGQLDEPALVPLVNHLRDAVVFARRTGRVYRDDEARARWRERYHDLSQGHPGLLGAVIARAEAQVMRLALVYALLARSTMIRREDLDAALALWSYCEQSARFVFGDSLGDPVADELVRALRASPAGMTRTEIRDLFGRHRRAEEVGRALGVLLEQQLVRVQERETGGRPAERWYATEATKATEVPAVAPLSSLSALSSPPNASALTAEERAQLEAEAAAGDPLAGLIVES